MKKILIIIFTIVVMAAAGAFYFFKDDAPSKTNLKNLQSSKSNNTSSSNDINGLWIYNNHSNSLIGYRINEQFAGDTISKTAVGRTKDFGVEVLIEDKKIISSNINVNLDSLKSDSNRRDEKIKSDSLETEKFPTASLLTTKPIDLSSVKKNEKFQKKLNAILTLHGVQKNVEVDVEGLWDDSGVKLAGRLTIKLKDYNIVPPTIAGFVTVEDVGEIEFQILLVQKNK